MNLHLGIVSAVLTVCALLTTSYHRTRSAAYVCIHAKSSHERESESTEQLTGMSAHPDPDSAGQQPHTAFVHTLEQPMEAVCLHWPCQCDVMEINVT